MNLNRITDFTKWSTRTKLFTVITTFSAGASFTAFNVAPIDAFLIGSLTGLFVANADKLFKKREEKRKSVDIKDLKTFNDLMPLGVGDFKGKKFEKSNSHTWTPTKEYREFMSAKQEIGIKEGLI